MIEEISLSSTTISGAENDESSILITETENISLLSRIHHFCTVGRSCGSDRTHKIISIVLLATLVVAIASIIIVGIFVTRDFSTLITIGAIIGFIIIYGIVCHMVQCMRLCGEEYQALEGLVEQ
ncbi:hypothetical protein TNCT_585051 [Trichonephila clavata]|uniref:Uncharacterized protein n=1 Tax=Trichonephila clavata TaxID=2740835 RepID=A0A8X6GK63_TRICU|nr:hypothetical protein TNCT_585051 [Trichonephila clavata]